MADVINISAEDNRNIIDDDAVPALTLESTHASGYGLKVTNTNAAGGTAAWVVSTAGTALNVDGTAGVGIDVDSGGANAAINALSAGAQALIARSQATEANVIDLAHDTALSSATVAVLKAVSSTASAPLFEFGNVDTAVVSTASAGATLAYGVRVKVGNTYGWLPVYIDIA